MRPEIQKQTGLSKERENARTGLYMAQHDKERQDAPKNHVKNSEMDKKTEDALA